MTATLHRLRAIGLRVTLEGDRIKAGPSKLLTAELANLIRQGKAALLAELRQELIEDVTEFARERAAIAEFDGNLPRKGAEQLAVDRAIVRFQLHDLYGNPKQQGGGSVIGSDTDTVQTLIESLQARYGNRLASISET